MKLLRVEPEKQKKKIEGVNAVNGQSALSKNNLSIFLLLSTEETLGK